MYVLRLRDKRKMNQKKLLEWAMSCPIAFDLSSYCPMASDQTASSLGTRGLQPGTHGIQLSDASLYKVGEVAYAFWHSDDDLSLHDQIRFGIETALVSQGLPFVCIHTRSWRTFRWALNVATLNA